MSECVSLYVRVHVKNIVQNYIFDLLERFYDIKESTMDLYINGDTRVC